MDPKTLGLLVAVFSQILIVLAQKYGIPITTDQTYGICALAIGAMTTHAWHTVAVHKNEMIATTIQAKQAAVPDATPAPTPLAAQQAPTGPGTPKP